MKEAPIKVTLTEPGIAGSYDVVERREDGTLVLRPETSDEVIEQFFEPSAERGRVHRELRSPRCCA